MMRSTLLTVLIFLVFTGQAWAHTGLKQSFPADHETVTQSPRDVRLTFHTRIGSISTMSIEDDKGNELPLSAVTVDGERMVGTFRNPLDSGAYQVTWRIAGLDGHVIEQSYLFFVKLPQATVVPASERPSPVALQPTEQPDQDDQNGRTSGSPIFMVIVGLLMVVLIGLGMMGLAIRRTGGRNK